MVVDIDNHRMTDLNNVIFLEWLNKKSFPPGDWLKEPDLGHWESYNFSCLAVRDMSLGVWKGFVGVENTHPFYSKSIEDILKTDEAADIFFSVYGGICTAGPLIQRYKSYSRNLWWIGIETSHGADLMPLLKLDMQNPDIARSVSGQTYKNFPFIHKEINKLARYISKVK